MRRDILAVALLTAAALVPRIWLLSSTAQAGLFADMVDYHDRARYLVEYGRLYPDAFRVPAYPIALAGVFAGFGTDLRGLRILQCVILTLVALATYALASGAMSRGRAFAAGLIVAWYPGLLLYTVYVMAEPLYTLLVLLALLCARSTTVIAAFGAGVLGGLATLTRQAGVAIVAVLSAWMATRPWISSADQPAGSRGRRRSGEARRSRAHPRPRPIVLAAVLIAGAALTIAPWVWRNYAVFGRLMALETTGGITFLMANYEEATGRYLLTDWTTVHQRYLGSEPDEFARNATAYRLGFQKIAADPLRILALVPRRLGYLFDLEGREHLWLYTSGYFGPRSRGAVVAFGWALLLSFPILVIAAILSLAFGPPPRTSSEMMVILALGATLVQLLTVFGDPRFHLPLIPFLALLAVRPWRGDERPSWWRRGCGVIVLIAAVTWWATRLPNQLRSLEHATAPNGWQSPLPY